MLIAYVLCLLAGIAIGIIIKVVVDIVFQADKIIREKNNE
jgi:hypothetical protein